MIARHLTRLVTLHTHAHVSLVFQREESGILVLIALGHGSVLVASMLARIGVVTPLETLGVELGY